MVPQVNKKHYFEEYDSLQRFISYFYQIDLAKKLKAKRILEIGIGNKLVTNYLREKGEDIDTCDFDKTLNPDYVADIRSLPFKDSKYDLIMAYEVLEHIPWKDLDKALSELYRVSKKYVIISIPYSSISFEFIFKFPFAKNFLQMPFLDIFLRIPLFFKKIKFNGEHYWEMGRKNYPISRVRKELKSYFKIKKEIRPVLNSYHYFFILEKKLFRISKKSDL